MGRTVIRIIWPVPQPGQRMTGWFVGFQHPAACIRLRKQLSDVFSLARSRHRNKPAFQTALKFRTVFRRIAALRGDPRPDACARGRQPVL